MSTRDMKMMTNRGRNKRAQKFGGLKAFLVVGAFAATLVGTRLLAYQETAVVPKDAVIIQETAPDTILVMPNSSKTITLELAPIPQAITPDIRPVARSTSSR